MSHHKILIIEDEPLVLKSYQDYFSRKKYNVAVAHDGAEGLQVVASFKPDLILLDILMPVMDGRVMLAKLRASPATAQLPVIILTNLDTPESVSSAIQDGVNFYLIKSNYSLEELEKKVVQILAH